MSFEYVIYLHQELIRTHRELEESQQARINSRAREIRTLQAQLSTSEVPAVITDPFQSHHGAYAQVINNLEHNRVAIFCEIYVQQEALYHQIERPTLADWDAADYTEDHLIQVTYVQLLDLITVISTDHHIHL